VADQINAERIDAVQVDFDEFVRARSHRLLRIAFALTGDLMHAEDLLQSSLVRAWSVWRRVDGDPEPYVRRILVNTFNSWWGRRWHGERPAAELPDRGGHRPQDDVDERDALWRALCQLPRQQRTVLVLRYFQDMSEAQIAEAMCISAGSVKNYASKGLAKLRTDPSLITLPDIGSSAERLTSVHARLRQRRRNRKVTVAAGAAVVAAALLAGYAIAADRRLTPDPALTPSPTPSVPTALPEYTSGKRVQATLPPTPFSTPETTFTWTPLTTGLVFIGVECHHVERGRRIGVSIRINSYTTSWASPCDNTGIDRGFDGWQTSALAYPDHMGIAVGQDVAVTVTLFRYSMGSFKDSGGPLPDSGSYQVAIAQEVAFEQYPLPSRPAVLEPLTLDPRHDALARFRAGGPHQATITWPGAIEISARSQTPGILRFWINGSPIPSATSSFWTYDSNHGTHLFDVTVPQDMVDPPRLGASVTIAVQAQYMTADWVVEILPSWPALHTPTPTP